jgi:transcriptional regulator with XRE-family HTH domain
MKKANRIAELRQGLGWTQDDLAEKLETHRVTINRLENGATRLNTDWLDKLAAVFRVAPQDILARANDTYAGERVDVIGRVEAGAWQEHNQWPDSQRYSIAVPLGQEYRNRQKFASEVRGNSMNELYPDGSIVVWLPFAMHPESLRPGRKYIVERQRSGDYEVTLKEYVVDANNREWLNPRSTDPDHQERIPLIQNVNETIRIVGRVIFALRREES